VISWQAQGNLCLSNQVFPKRTQRIWEPALTQQNAGLSDTRGLRVGDPLTMFRGVLTGTPAYTGNIDPLLEHPLPPGMHHK
jgi:hypothetical protein